MPNARWIAILLGSAAALAVTGCGGDEAPPRSAARAAADVAIADVAITTVPVTLEADGAVEARVSVSPGTKIMGRVERVTVRLGDRVERGDLLATLEHADLAAAADEARAAVAVAEASLANAGAQHGRMTELHARRSVTDKNLEDAVAGFRIAEAQLERARAALAAAEVMLGYARITAPVGGHVTAKRIEEGDMAAPGIPLFTVEDTSTVTIAAALAESDVVGLAAGTPASVSVDVLDRTYDAAIDRVVPAGDPRSRTFRVELVLDNADGELRSGMFARVLFELARREAVTVPRTALVSRGQLRGVFVVDDASIATLRWIRLGRERGTAVEVLSGLAPGERFVPAPPPGFADGTPVAAR